MFDYKLFSFNRINNQKKSIIIYLPIVKIDLLNFRDYHTFIEHCIKIQSDGKIQDANQL